MLKLLHSQMQSLETREADAVKAAKERGETHIGVIKDTGQELKVWIEKGEGERGNGSEADN